MQKRKKCELIGEKRVSNHSRKHSRVVIFHPSLRVSYILQTPHIYVRTCSIYIFRLLSEFAAIAFVFFDMFASFYKTTRIKYSAIALPIRLEGLLSLLLCAECITFNFAFRHKDATKITSGIRRLI